MSEEYPRVLKIVETPEGYGLWAVEHVKGFPKEYITDEVAPHIRVFDEMVSPISVFAAMKAAGYKKKDLLDLMENVYA